MATRQQLAAIAAALGQVLGTEIAPPPPPEERPWALAARREAVGACPGVSGRDELPGHL